MGKVLLEILEKGFVGAIHEVINIVVSFLGGKIPEKAILIVGMVLAILVGTLGYKYIKLLSTTVFSIVGFVIGFAGFRMLKAQFAWNIPETVDYVVGIVVLAFLGYLAYKKFSYALFTIAGATGFLIGYFISSRYLEGASSTHYWVGAAAAIVIALVAMSFVRYGFISVLSVGAGFTFMAMLSELFPSIRFFSTSEGFVGILLAIIIACAFAAIQCYLSRKEAKIFKGPRRVKIRRVFDTW